MQTTWPERRTTSHIRRSPSLRTSFRAHIIHTLYHTWSKYKMNKSTFVHLCEPCVREQDVCLSGVGCLLYGHCACFLRGQGLSGLVSDSQYHRREDNYRTQYGQDTRQPPTYSTASSGMTSSQWRITPSAKVNTYQIWQGLSIANDAVYLHM